MRRGRLLQLFLLVALLCTLMLPVSALAKGPEDAPSSMEGTWTVSVHWANPEVIGDYSLQVRMLTANFGLVDAGGYAGFLFTDGQRVLWTAGRPWIAAYFGTVSGSSGSGWMINTSENYGTWTAVQASAGTELSAPGGSDVATGLAD